jgi:hypothetical protein
MWKTQQQIKLVGRNGKKYRTPIIFRYCDTIREARKTARELGSQGDEVVIERVNHEVLGADCSDCGEPLDNFDRPGWCAFCCSKYEEAHCVKED